MFSGVRSTPMNAPRAKGAHDSSTAYRAGDRVGGKYLLVAVLGVGGMGTVWRAKNESLGVDVALKLILRSSADERALERFAQEARAAARIAHPSVVRVFDYGTTPRGDPYIAMDLLDGGSLGDFLEKRRRVPAPEALALMLPVARALAAAHECGVVHRDLKPDNIVLARQDDGSIVPKIVDFGIAKLRIDDVDRNLTVAGTVLGSPDYLSPEQARGVTDVDEGVDIWAFTVVVYELVTGVRPFNGDNYNALLTAIITETPASTTDLAAGDERLWSILERGFAKRTEDRWPSMAAYEQALVAWLQSVSEEAAGSSRTPDASPRAEPSTLVGARPAVVATVIVPAQPAPSATQTTPTPDTWRALESAPSSEPRARSRAPIAVALGLAAVAAGVAIVALRKGTVAPPTAPAALLVADASSAPAVAREPIASASAAPPAAAASSVAPAKATQPTTKRGAPAAEPARPPAPSPPTSPPLIPKEPNF